VLQEITSWDRGHWSRLQEATFIVPAQTPADLCPKAEPQEQRYLTIYTLASRLQKQKAKLNPHMAVTSLAISFPQCYVTFMFQFFKFYLFALPSLPPVLWSEHSLFLFCPPPPTFLLYLSPLWCSDPPRVKEHHLDLEVCIFVASLHVWLFCQQIESSCCFISYTFNNSL
jgi:hypothetical protein